jgi:cytoskeletal protein RodZ
MMFSKKRPQSREVDEKLNELGTILKEAREKKGISLEDLFETTKIQVKLLRALEDGNYAAYPGDVYVRGALRNYAEAVGLDYKEVSALYRKAKGEGVEEAQPEPESIEKEPEKAEPIIIQQRVKKSKGMRSEKKRTNLKPLFTAIAILLILFLGAMGINYILNNPGNNTLPPVDDPSVNDPANGSDPDTEDPDPDGSEPGEVEPALFKADPRREDYTLQGAEKIQLEITFTGDCWVRVDQGGEKVMSTTFRNGQTYTLDADQELVIRLGYPRRVSAFQVNGLDIQVIDTRDPYNITINLEP